MADATASEERTYTLEKANRFFAVDYFNGIWPLLDKAERSPEEDEEMVHKAHASLLHWRAVGTPLNEQRGQWMLARVYTVVGNAERAMHHARICHALTVEQGLEDFDLGYGHECMARAAALAQERELFAEHYAKAKAVAVKGEKDREIFEGDLVKGPWFGMVE